jgi:hypothetical protein
MIRNSKYKIPNNVKIPNSMQVNGLVIRELGFIWDLEIGNWNL